MAAYALIADGGNEWPGNVPANEPPDYRMSFLYRSLAVIRSRGTPVAPLVGDKAAADLDAAGVRGGSANSTGCSPTPGA